MIYFIFVLIMVSLFFLVLKKWEAELVPRKKYQWFGSFSLAIIFGLLFLLSDLSVIESPFISGQISGDLNQLQNNSVIYLLDISNSMDALDGTELSRLDAARSYLSRDLDRYSNSALFELWCFKGELFRFGPGSLNKNEMLQLLDSVSTSLSNSRGSSLTASVISLLQIKKEFAGDLIIISDGESTSSFGESTVFNADLKNSKISSLRIIGIGPRQLLPLVINGVNMMDASEKQVMTQLNTELLNKLGVDFHGEVFTVYSDETLDFHNSSHLSVPAFVLQGSTDLTGILILSVYVVFILLILEKFL